MRDGGEKYRPPLAARSSRRFRDAVTTATIRCGTLSPTTVVNAPGYRSSVFAASLACTCPASRRRHVLHQPPPEASLRASALSVTSACRSGAFSRPAVSRPGGVLPSTLPIRADVVVLPAPPDTNFSVIEMLTERSKRQDIPHAVTDTRRRSITTAPFVVTPVVTRYLSLPRPVTAPIFIRHACHRLPFSNIIDDAV